MGGIFSAPKAPAPPPGPSQAELDAIARREKLAEETKAREWKNILEIQKKGEKKMPQVMYKTKDGMKSKSFSYNKSGLEQAKAFAKLTGGKMKMSVNESKMKFAKKG